MPTRQNTAQPLSPELDAIATAAAHRLRAQCGDDPALSTSTPSASPTPSATRSARASPSARSPTPSGSASSAPRDELRTDTLRRVERAAKRKRDADTDYEHAIDRAARRGLSHREIATAAHVTHGTVRAILTRSETTSAAAKSPVDEQGAAQGRRRAAGPSVATAQFCTF